MEPGTDEEQSCSSDSLRTYSEVPMYGLDRPRRRRKRKGADREGMIQCQSAPVLPFQECVNAHDDGTGSHHDSQDSTISMSSSHGSRSKKTSRRDYPGYGIDNSYRPRAGSQVSSGGDSGTNSPKSGHNSSSISLGKRRWSNNGLTDSFAESMNVSTPGKYKRFKARDTLPYPDTPMEDSESPFKSNPHPQREKEDKEKGSADDIDYAKVNKYLRDIRLSRERRKEQTPPPAPARAGMSINTSSSSSSSSASPGQNLLHYQGQSRYHQEYLERQRAVGDDLEEMAVDPDL